MKQKGQYFKRRIQWLWSWMLAVLSGFSTLFVTGCFGMYLPAAAYMPPDSIGVYGLVQDEDTSAVIAGIRVKLLNAAYEQQDSVLSETNGTYQVQVYYAPAGNYYLISEDIDGNTNGAYSPVTNQFNAPNSYYVTNISLLMKTNN